MIVQKCNTAGITWCFITMHIGELSGLGVDGIMIHGMGRPHMQVHSMCSANKLSTEDAFVRHILAGCLISQDLLPLSVLEQGLQTWSKFKAAKEGKLLVCEHCAASDCSIWVGHVGKMPFRVQTSRKLVRWQLAVQHLAATLDVGHETSPCGEGLKTVFTLGEAINHMISRVRDKGEVRCNLMGLSVMTSKCTHMLTQETTNFTSDNVICLGNWQ